MAFLRFRKRQRVSWAYAFAVGAGWLTVALVLDFLFIVIMFNAWSYYRPHIFVYYALTLSTPTVAGGTSEQNSATYSVDAGVVLMVRHVLIEQNWKRHLSARGFPIRIPMSNMKSWLAIVLGVIIAILDLWWTYASIGYQPWETVGIVIFVATIVWIYLDYDLMKK